MLRPFQSDVKHIATVEERAMEGARIQQWLHPRVADAAMTVRREWRRVCIEGPTLPLAALIELVGRRYSIWPAPLDLQQTVTRQRRILHALSVFR